MKNLFFNRDYICIHRGEKYYLMNRKTLQKFDLNGDSFEIIRYIHDNGLSKEDLQGLNSNLLSFVNYLQENQILVGDESKRGLYHIKDLRTRPHLLKIFLELTHRCNLKCKHCYTSSGMQGSDENELTTEEIKKMVDEAHELGIWHFDLTGGEPFVRDDIYEILEYMGEKGMIVNIFTNLTLLDEEKIERLRDLPVSQYNVSFDSHIGHIQDEFRGVKGAHQKTVENIKLMRDRGLTVQLNMVIGDHNFDTLDEMVSYIQDELGVHFTADVITPAGRGREYYDEYKYAKTIAYVNSLHFSENKRCLVKEMGDFEAPQQTHCGVGDNFIFVTANGNANLCPSLTYRESPELCVGNLRESSILEIWGKLIDKFGGVDCEVHDDCPEKEKCAGGCRSRAFAVTGSVNAPDMSYCIQYGVDSKCID